MNKTKKNTKTNRLGKAITSISVISLGIALIVSTGLIGTAASPIFQETFENLDEWYLVVYDSAGGSYWDPAPRLDTTMGEPAPSLDVNGNSWCGDGAYSKETFDYTNGLVIEFDMYVATGYDWNWGDGGLSDHMPNLDNPRSDGAYVDPLRCDPHHVARVWLSDDGNYNQQPSRLGFDMRSEDGGESYLYSYDASPFQNEWHTYMINILPDGYVEFYMDGTFIWKSTKKIDKTLSPMPLVFGSRDANGPVRIDNVKVIVEDTTPPEITCPADETVEQETADGTVVPLTATATDTCDPDPTITSDELAIYPLGTTTVTFTATDDSGNSASCTTTVTVVDTTLPDISVTVSPDTLWPPNHKMVDIAATVTVSDICDAAPSVVLTSVTSNEPDNDQGKPFDPQDSTSGDGNTNNDIQGAEIGTEDYEFQLRAERAGAGDGRVYTITYTVTDASGNSASASATVVVPHDMG